MRIVKVDLLDGNKIDVVVSDELSASRLCKFVIDSDTAFSDRDRWLKVRSLMNHEHHGPNVGWTLPIVLPGDCPDSAIDNYVVPVG